MRGARLVRVVLVLGLSAAATLAAQVSDVAKLKPVTAFELKKPPVTCPTGQLGFQKPDGKWTCIAADSNPCPRGQFLDKSVKPGFAECKPLPAKKPFTCPAGQFILQKPTGQVVCVAAEPNPCPPGQVLDTTVKPGYGECKGLPAKKPFTCPAGQFILQKPTGQVVCVAAEPNPCPPGQVLDTTVKPGYGECKGLPAKKPFTCPAGQFILQKPTGQVVCVAAEPNPCPPGQVLDTTIKPGYGECKPASR